MSGSVLSSYTHWDKHPRLYGQRLAQDLGCERATNAATVACLQALDALTLQEHTLHFLQMLWTGPNVWHPFSDAHFAAADPFLPLDPATALRTGRFTRVPMIMGTNHDEGAFNLIGYLKGFVHLEDVERDWETVGPLILFHRSIDEVTEKDVELAGEVKRFYFGDRPIAEETTHEYVKMMGDHMFLAGVDQTVE